MLPVVCVFQLPDMPRTLDLAGQRSLLCSRQQRHLGYFTQICANRVVTQLVTVERDSRGKVISDKGGPGLCCEFSVDSLDGVFSSFAVAVS